MSTGFKLFQKGEVFYHQGDISKAFESYQQSIKQIVKNEQVAAKVPAHMIAHMPADIPLEILPNVWRHFCGFMRDGKMNFTEVTAPDAYKLLYSYRPGSSKEHPKFRGNDGHIMLMALQITAGLTLGLMAWDKTDRATAAKRYKEALDLAATHPPFLSESAASSRIEKWVARDVLETKENLAILVGNDIFNAELLNLTGNDGGNIRRTTVDNIGMKRVEKDSTVTWLPGGSVMVATDACNQCGKRDIKLLRCAKCTSVAYCGAQCQKADWKNHKLKCHAPA
ncbi:hypothetical protein C8J56DRAFT_1022870 [Mycena floridula]|nr:hypothetical protein C8J56DRAFT_1022870 [Mycena floridula]